MGVDNCEEGGAGQTADRQKACGGQGTDRGQGTGDPSFALLAEITKIQKIRKT